MVHGAAGQDAQTQAREGIPMNLKMTLGLVALVAFTANTATAGLPKIFRAQTPDPAMSSGPAVYVDEGTGPIIGTAPGYGERPRYPGKHNDFRMYNGVQNHSFGYGNGYYGGHEEYYRPGHPPVNPQYKVSGQGDCPCGNAGCTGLPHHYNTYRYKGYDNNYVYPSNQVPAGMVTYPYYTHKGPSDFFMK